MVRRSLGRSFDGKRERIIQHPVALGKRHAVLLEVRRILFRVEFDGHTYNICTLCISVNIDSHWRVLRLLSANEAVEKVLEARIGLFSGVRLPLPRVLASNLAHSER